MSGFVEMMGIGSDFTLTSCSVFASLAAWTSEVVPPGLKQAWRSDLLVTSELRLWESEVGPTFVLPRDSAWAVWFRLPSGFRADVDAEDDVEDSFDALFSPRI